VKSKRSPPPRSESVAEHERQRQWADGWACDLALAIRNEDPVEALGWAVLHDRFGEIRRRSGGGPSVGARPGWSAFPPGGGGPAVPRPRGRTIPRQKRREPSPYHAPPGGGGSNPQAVPSRHMARDCCPSRGAGRPLIFSERTSGGGSGNSCRPTGFPSLR